MPGFADEQKRVLAATVDGVRVVCVYVPNGESVESDKYQYKLRWLDALHDWLAEELKRYPQLAVLGDYNIAPEDRDVHDPRLWEGKVLFSEPEKRGVPPPARPGAEGQLPPVRAAGEVLHLVGLPHERVQAQHGPAHRPHPAVARRWRRAARRSRIDRACGRRSGRPTTRRWSTARLQ